MKSFNEIVKTPIKEDEIMVMIPLSLITSMHQKQDEILSHLRSKEHAPIPALKEYISEPEARKLLNKKTTWFWSLRESGKLTGKRVGGTRYYKMSEIEQLFNDGK